MKAFLKKYHHQIVGTIYLLCVAVNLFVVWWRWPDPFLAFSAFFAGIILFAAIDKFMHAWWLVKIRREIDEEYAEHRAKFATYANKTIREVVQSAAAEHGMTAVQIDDHPTRH